MYLDPSELAAACQELSAVKSEEDLAAAAAFVETYESFQNPELVGMLVEALAVQFEHLVEADSDEAAIECSRRLFERFGDSREEAVEVVLSLTLVRTAYLWESLEAPDQEIAAYQRHVARFKGHSNQEIAAQNAEMYFFLGITLNAAGVPGSALEVYQEMLATYETPTYAHNAVITDFCAKVHINLAGIHFDAGEEAKATRAYLDLLRAFPEGHPTRPLDPIAMALVCLAEDCIGTGDDAGCAAWLGKALPILEATLDDPLQYEKYIVAQFCLWFIGDPRGSLDHLKACIETYDAAEDDWYIVWEMDGMKARMDERSAEEQVVVRVVMDHLLGTLSAKTALERLK